MPTVPPTLVQYKGNTAASVTSLVTTITYQAGDTVLAWGMDGNGRINGLTDSGGSSFTLIATNPGSVMKLWGVLSANASTTVTLTQSGAVESMSMMVAVFRDVSAIGGNTNVNGTSTTPTATQSISAGSKFVGGLGVAFNGAGSTTLAGITDGTKGDFRTSVGTALSTGPLLGLVDLDASVSAGASKTLTLTASRSSNWQAIAVELSGTANPAYFVTDDYYVVGDIIDSDGLIHAAVARQGNNLTLTGQKGSFPCIPQNGGSPVTQTYAMGHLSTRLSFTYGTVEAKIKMPGFGVHSAFWMLGVPCKPWPNAAASNWSNPPSGEIDIAEIVNNDLTHVRSAYANGAGFVTTDTALATPTTAFHVYKLTWAPGVLTWFIDGSQVNTATLNVPNYPMYVLLGGYMGEVAITDGLLPTQMQVQYLKITAQDGTTVLLNLQFASGGGLLLRGVG